MGLAGQAADAATLLGCCQLLLDNN